MTSPEMKQEFLILYDKITNFDAPGYNDLEISVFLTKGQEREFLDLYKHLGNPNRIGFEETEARRKDLKELVEGVTITSPSADQTNALPNGVFFDLPTDCLYAISEEVTLTSADTCTDGTRIRVKPVLHDEYTINLKNPFKKPSKDLAWRLDYSTQRHEIVTDGTYTIDDYHLRYLKRLSPIIVGSNTVDGLLGPSNSTLDAITHKRIVDRAVRIAAGTTDPQSYQIKTIEQQDGA